MNTDLPPYPIPRGARPPCRDVDPEAFFADQAVARAKAACDGCPFRGPCGEYALHRSVDGVWAGTTSDERKVLRRKRGIVPAATDFSPFVGRALGLRNTVVHGTADGVEAHRKRYQPLCDDCSAFEQGRYVANRQPCPDCGKTLLPESMRKHKRMHCAKAVA